MKHSFRFFPEPVPSLSPPFVCFSSSTVSASTLQVSCELYPTTLDQRVDRLLQALRGPFFEPSPPRQIFCTICAPLNKARSLKLLLKDRVQFFFWTASIPATNLVFFQLSPPKPDALVSFEQLQSPPPRKPSQVVGPLLLSRRGQFRFLSALKTSSPFSHGSEPLEREGIFFLCHTLLSSSSWIRTAQIVFF